MPPTGRNQKFNKEAQKSSAFGKAIQAGLTDANRNVLNAVEFIEGPTGLGVTLRPVQRVITKCLFGVPFDLRPAWADRIPNWGKVEMWDVFRDKCERIVTEAEYLHIAYNEGRCNVGDWRDIPNLGRSYSGYNEACVFAGRRGGKSELVAAITSYKLYLLLNIPSPQVYFGLVPGSPIDITYLAQDEKGADRLFKKLREDVNRATFFEPFLKDNNNKQLTFVCEADRHKNATQNPTPTLTVWSLPCIEEHELIWKKDGLAEIGSEVNPGDVVLDAYGNQQVVTRKQFNEREVWALETENFRNDPLLLTPNHTCIFVPADQAKLTLPYLKERIGRKGAIDSRHKMRFSTHPNTHKWIEGQASDIATGDYLLFPRIPENQRKTYIIDNSSSKTPPYIASCFGHKYIRQESGATPVPAFQISPVLCRLWGLYLAEGSISKDDASVNWHFHIKEKNTLAKFIQEGLLSELGLSSTIYDKLKSNGCVVMCSSVQLARGIRKLFGKGCGEKTLPAEALYWTSECQKALIKGWLEGDGCHDRAVGPTVSRKLAYSLFAIGIQAGMLPAVKRRPAYTDKNGVFHRQSWYVSFNKYERHYRFFQKIGNQEFYWSKVLRNAPTNTTVRVVDISVENTESFLTKLAAVHNCTTNAVRGPSSVFLALDEFAHFRSAKGSTSEDMYASATPATGSFAHTEILRPDGTTAVISRLIPDEDEEPEKKFENLEEGVLDERAVDELLEHTDDISEQVYEKQRPKLGEPVGEPVEILDSMIFSISSPLKKVGKMYELHRLALTQGPSSTIFTLNCSSAEMNNKIPKKFLQTEFQKNNLTFKCEYGGQFLESSESYVTEAAVRECVDVKWDVNGVAIPETARHNVIQFHPEQIGRQYFWAFDLGMVNDGSALAIAHLEFGGGGLHGIRLIFDYIDRMMVGEAFQGPGVVSGIGDQKYHGYNVLPLADILDWLSAMNRIMPCFRGATDQHGGQQLVQLLELREIHNIELINLTPAINSQMAYALRGYIENKLTSFPYIPKFIQELKLLELEVASKYQIKVQAPLEKGAHDDMADSAMLCAFLAQTWLIEEGNLRMDPTGLSLLMASQMNKKPTPISNLDGVELSTLRIMERMKQVTSQTGGFSSLTAPRSPWHRRGGRR